MDTMKCSACGKAIPSDAVRCSYCGQIQGFGMHTLGGELKSREKPAIEDVQKPQPEPTEEAAKVEEPQKPTAPEKGKTSKLKSILTGENSDTDLDGLRLNDLLPGGETEAKSVEPATGDIPKPEEPAGHVFTNSLPDWLLSDEFKPAGDAASAIEEAAAQGDLIASMGEIPDWVRKLQAKIERREAPALISETSQITPEPVVAPGKTKVGSAKERQIPSKIDVQEPDAGLIESVKAYIGGLKTAKKKPPDGSRRLSRYIWGVIGLAMFSLAAALLWSGSAVAGTSQPAGASLVGMTSHIDTISLESVVLIGIDYDLSLAGEINNTALPVIVHLMSKKVSLAFVPTRTTGSAMAKYLFNMGKKWSPDYPTQKAFMFPFLPGEATGLLQLATAPRDALPTGIDGTNPWSSYELANIQDISDFSMVLLLTDSAKSGRDWLEQVQPQLKDTPLYVITSRQAAPILKPYQESGQIQAMVAGISEGADYERIYLLTTNNQQMQKAYNGVLLFMAVLFACIIVLSIFPQNPKIRSGKGSRNHAAR